MNSIASRRLLPFQVLLWLVPIAAVAWWASTQKAPQLPDSFGAVMGLVGAIAVYALGTLGRAERWHQILGDARIRTPRRESYSLVTVGYMGNNVLPARGGEVLRVFLLGSRTGASKRSILGTILAERVLDAVALGMILLIVAYNLLTSLRMPSGSLLLAGAGLLTALAAVGGFVLWRSPTLGARILETGRHLLRPCRQLLSRRGAALLALSLGIWALEAAVYVIVGATVGLHLGVQGGLSVVAFSNLCALVPAAPGYLGTYDAAVGFAVKATTGVGSVLTYLLLLRFVLFVPITLVGLVLLFARYGGFSRVRAARAAAAATA
ncbi:MAG: glycosyltransferase 2 family protein [Solirubrobacteraceae bacterium]|jgi:uncharacterized membrane protein YbhN (UPF0104 family)|nr:glycosyltransferase 2 family protein [Solirubrobacteraceae bacterium]